MMKGNSHGFNWGGLYVTGMIDHHAGWRERADELPDTVKVTMLLGEYFTSRYRGRYYAKCQNLARRLRSAYDAALQTYDVLLMPTVPVRASELPKPGCGVRIADAGVRDAREYGAVRRPGIPPCRCRAGG